jgi:hypothetical protein
VQNSRRPESEQIIVVGYGRDENRRSAQASSQFGVWTKRVQLLLRTPKPEVTKRSGD